MLKHALKKLSLSSHVCTNVTDKISHLRTKGQTNSI